VLRPAGRSTLAVAAPQARVAEHPYGGVMHEEDAIRADSPVPICPTCGVTALPGSAVGLLVDFACDNADCAAFGERVGR
jgi:hypothetical protein